MKTKLIGWLYIIFAALLIGLFLLNLLTLLDGGSIVTYSTATIRENLVATTVLWSLPLAIFMWTLGSAVKRHKRWSWYIGIVLSVFNLVTTLFTSISSLFSLFSLLILAIQGLILYSFLSEKRLFFSETSSLDTPPQKFDGTIAS